MTAVEVSQAWADAGGAALPDGFAGLLAEQGATRETVVIMVAQVLPVWCSAYPDEDL